MLRAAGFETDEAKNGREAVAAVVSGSFDAVLMDCEMPEMDGFSATREIRRKERSGDLPHSIRTPLPVIAVTAQAVEGDRQRCLGAGMTDYVTKPVDRALLLRRLERLVPAESPADAALPSTDASAVAIEELRDRCAGQDEVVARVLGLFQERSREQAEQLAAALENDDVEAIGQLAHALKGSAANVAASHVTTAAADLETAARNGQNDQLRALIGRVNTSLDSCQRRIDLLLS